MGKKKKKLFPAYFYGTTPFSSNEIINPYAGIVLPPREGRVDSQGNIYWEYTDEMRRRDGLLPSPSKPRSTKNIQGFTDAMFEYGAIAAADPFNIAEGLGYAGALGVSWRMGYLLAIARGVIVMSPILAAIDPLHKWDGGLDETRAYKAAAAGVSGAHPNLNKQIVMGQGSWGSVV